MYQGCVSKRIKDVFVFFFSVDMFRDKKKSDTGIWRNKIAKKKKLIKEVKDKRNA